MKLTLSEIAKYLDGDVVGDSSCLIDGVSEIQNSKKGTITFLGNPLYHKYLKKTNASAIMVTDASLLDGKNGIVVSNPQLAMARTLGLFIDEKEKLPLIHPKSVISNNAKIGKNINIESGAVIENNVIIGDGCSIGPNTILGANTILGENCTIFGNVSIYDQTLMGSNVVIHSGTVIGCDGFGYVTLDDTHEKIPQTGNVIIGDDVEIGSNCSIDRATIGSTIISEMTKIDNLVHIAHNVKIGKGCLLTAGFAIAGSSEVGDYCTFAGQVGIAPHLKIGDRSIVAAKSGVTKSLKGNKVYAGFPAREIKEHNRRLALVNEIEKLRDKLIKIKRDD